MSYRNEIHNLDSNGDPTPVMKGDILPGVTADHTQDPCCEFHSEDGVEATQCCDRCPDAESDEPVAVTTIVIDMWEVNQRAMERAVAAGQPLPDGVTADMVRTWREERGPGEVSTQTAELVPLDVTELAEEVGVDDRCPATCGLPADSDPAKVTKASCPVHPDGAHRCYRRPRHQAGQTDETGGRIHDTDHECDCGYVWLSLTGGMAEMDRVVDGRRRMLAEILDAIELAGQPGHVLHRQTVLIAAARLGVRL